MHYHNLWYLLLKLTLQNADHQAPKSPMDILTPCKIFCNNFKLMDVYKSHKTLNNIQNRVFFVTQVPYHAIKVIAES